MEVSMSKTTKGSLAAEGARRATGEASDARPDRGRFSMKRKMAAVMRLLRGEDIDRVSRELKVTGATLSAWREDFLAGGQANLKTREPNVQDEEILSLKAMVGDLTMRNEVLRQRARALEANLPLALRRSRR
jgi:Transposase